MRIIHAAKPWMKSVVKPGTPLHSALKKVEGFFNREPWLPQKQGSRFYLGLLKISPGHLKSWILFAHALAREKKLDQDTSDLLINHQLVGTDAHVIHPL
jgi:hypothetical protein